MSNKNAALLTICFLTLWLTASYAEPLANNTNTTTHEQTMQQKHEEFTKELNLTQEQKDKIKAQRDSTKDKMKQLSEELKAKRLELKTEIEKPDMSSSKINSLASSIKNLYGQLLDIKISSATFLKEVLTAEQFSKMQKKIEETKEKMKDKTKHNKNNK